MARLIVQLGPDEYLEWSTICDAPATCVMTEAELREYILDESGRNGLDALDERLARCAEHGTSSTSGTTLTDLLGHNRAGPNETHLRTVDALRKRYDRSSPDFPDADSSCPSTEGK